MSKTPVTQQGFIEACNARLAQLDGFQTGMEFFLTPVGSTDGHARGVDNAGPYELTSIYAQAYHYVCERFEVPS
ncbi:hypothetical protein ACMHYO_16325 [Allopusillimonas ginsengisoli]|uniref:hypothetical protein n=1 Tax=Allopusillimonas ginsengisoli TaxID=453575 RepID=UPI0039C15397